MSKKEPVMIDQGKSFLDVQRLAKTISLYEKFHSHPEGKFILIDKSKATEVAKAIDPEYQKVIDQNAKLVEALRDVELCLESQLYNDEISRGVLSSLLQRVKALQNTKNIEG